jgi:hypothetical protein
LFISLPRPIKKRSKVSEIILTSIGSGHRVKNNKLYFKVLTHDLTLRVSTWILLYLKYPKP